eukprot:gene8671-1064_t
MEECWPVWTMPSEKKTISQKAIVQNAAPWRSTSPLSCCSFDSAHDGQNPFQDGKEISSTDLSDTEAIDAVHGPLLSLNRDNSNPYSLCDGDKAERNIEDNNQRALHFVQQPSIPPRKYRVSKLSFLVIQDEKNETMSVDSADQQTRGSPIRQNCFSDPCENHGSHRSLDKLCDEKPSKLVWKFLKQPSMFFRRSRSRSPLRSPSQLSRQNSHETDADSKTSQNSFINDSPTTKDAAQLCHFSNRSTSDIENPCAALCTTIGHNTNQTSSDCYDRDITGILPSAQNKHSVKSWQVNKDRRSSPVYARLSKVEQSLCNYDNSNTLLDTTTLGDCQTCERITVPPSPRMLRNTGNSDCAETVEDDMVVNYFETYLRFKSVDKTEGCDLEGNKCHIDDDDDDGDDADDADDNTEQVESEDERDPDEIAALYSTVSKNRRKHVSKRPSLSTISVDSLGYTAIAES